MTSVLRVIFAALFGAVASYFENLQRDRALVEKGAAEASNHHWEKADAARKRMEAVDDSSADAGKRLRDGTF